MSDKNTYVTPDGLKVFLSSLKNVFANLNHTHTKSEIVDFNEQDIVDKVIEQLPSAEGRKF